MRWMLIILCGLAAGIGLRVLYLAGRAADVPAPPPVRSSTAAEPAVPREVRGLVELAPLDATLVIDLRYATTRNFTGKRIYPEARAILHPRTAQKLIAANAECARHGYRLKIWDAYRPQSAHRRLWELAPDRRYVANPKKGSNHSRGAAVDVTLVDADGQELPMPTGFDEFSARAHINYRGGTAAARRNRDLLAAVMVKHGFRRVSREWWHFNDAHAARYPLRDVPFSAFAPE